MFMGRLHLVHVGVSVVPGCLFSTAISGLACMGDEVLLYLGIL